MNLFHLIGGKEIGGSKSHLLPVLNGLKETVDVGLCVFDWGEIPQEAKEAGIPVSWLQQKSRFDMTALWKLKATLQAHDVRLLHTHGPRANLYAYMLKKIYDFTWVSTVHSDPLLDFMGRGMAGKAYSYLNVQALRRADHIFSVTETFKSKLVGLGVKETRITPIYNGISFKDEEAGAYGAGDEHEAFTIINVGRLHPVKGHQTLIKAFKKVIDQTETDRPLKLKIVGDGETRQELEELVKTLDLQNHVTFTGYLTGDDLKHVYEEADLYVQSSLSESFPLVLLEAAKARVPIISTDAGGVRELITHPQYGWVVPPAEPVRLAAAMKEAVTAGDILLKKRSDALYYRASQSFSIERLVNTMQATYQSIV